MLKTFIHTAWFKVVFWIHFIHLFFALLPLWEPKNSKFLKNENNTWRYHHFAIVYQKSWSYTIQRYDTWWLQLFFILGHFLPFYSLTAWKIKIKKKWNKNLEISSFYTSAPKRIFICYTVPEIWHMTDVVNIFHFRLFFALLPPNSPKNQNFKKMKETP